jgi:SWI/SNF-related matrix-associated actin-dependent regulator of chromatin subfamily A-like protein 1
MTTIKNAANALLSVCDGAVSKDGSGFTAPDSFFVRDVLSKSYFTYNQERAIHKLLLKYKNQLLNSFNINYDQLSFEVEKPAVDITKSIPVKIIKQASNNAEKVSMPFGKYKGLSLDDVFHTDPGYINWIAKKFDNGYIKDCAMNLINGKPIEKEKLEMSLKNGKILIKSPFEYKDRIKELPERKWNADIKMWECPLSVLRAVTTTFPEAILSIELKHELEKASSIAKLSDLASDKNLNIKFGDLKLLPFQSVGVKFVENAGGRALIADEMGLGKTIQALAYLRLHPEIRPALIVCPASLKLNWRNEANKWLDTNDQVSVINKEIENNKSIYIINYDVLMKYQVPLAAMNFKAIILDESHYVKNQKAKRTEATIKIAENIPNRLLLTGTPVLNRPRELFTQLNIIDPVSYPKFTTFAFRYCDAQDTGYGWDFSGVSHVEELNDRLKTTMVRRTKDQVLQELPDKRRQTIVVPLSNEEEYFKAHNDFTKWLKATKGITTDAEHLVRIEMLKQLSATGKMSAIIENINNFLESGKKLVVFAHHKFVIDQLINEFGVIAVSLSGETTMENRQKAVDDFQHNPDVKLFIGNIQAAGVGITLTAAYDVMFVEFPWTPSQLYQAEDRLHRIGQKNAVNVMYMTGENTIDIDIAELIEKKAKVIDAVIDGKELSDFSILKNLITKYSN